MFTDDALYQEINAFVGAAEAVTPQSRQGRGTLGRLVNDPTAAKALEASLQNLEAVTARIESGEGSLGQLLARRRAGKIGDLRRRRTSTAITGADQPRRRDGGEAGDRRGAVQPAEFDGGSARQADDAALQQGEGTAGQLLRDRQLYENMNEAVSELRNLVRDIRADPRKYLNVRVSLF